jgi:hypothetical protein
MVIYHVHQNFGPARDEITVVRTVSQDSRSVPKGDSLGACRACKQFCSLMHK